MARSFISSWSVPFIAGTLFTMYVPWSRGDDAQLLGFLSDAQHANRGRYEFGRMNITAESGLLGEPTWRVRVDVDVRWNGPDSRVEGIRRANLEPGKSESKESVQRILTVRTKEALMMSVPDSKLARYDKVDPKKSTEFSRLRPSDWWYGRVDGEGGDWAEALDRMGPKFAQSPGGYTLKELDDDRIEFKQTVQGESTFRLVASKRFDGNVLEYVAQSPAVGGTITQKKTYAWGFHGRDVYLQRFDYELSQSASSGSSRTQGRYFRYRVNSIDPGDKPPSKLLDPRAVVLPAGTQVVDGVKSRRDRVGERPAGSVVEQLDRLAPEIKTRGFMKRDR